MISYNTQTLTENQVCAAQRCSRYGFSSTLIWALRVLEIPFLVKDASSKKCFSREKGICSTFSKCKSNAKCIIIWLQCLDILHMKWIHVMFWENPLDAGTGNLDCMQSDFKYSYLDSPVPAGSQSDGQSLCFYCPLPVSCLKRICLSWPPVQACKKIDLEYTSSCIISHTGTLWNIDWNDRPHYNLQPCMPNTYQLTLLLYNQPFY